MSDEEVRFNWQKDIIDFDDVFERLTSLDTDLLEEIHTFVKDEIWGVVDLLENRPDSLTKAYIRLFKTDMNEIISKAEMVKDTSIIYSNDFSIIENWQEKFSLISHLLSEEESRILILFYNSVNEIRKIVTESENYLHRTYRKYKPGQPMLDAVLSRYGRAYQGAINELLGLDYKAIMNKLSQLEI